MSEVPLYTLCIIRDNGANAPINGKGAALVKYSDHTQDRFCERVKGTV